MTQAELNNSMNDIFRMDNLSTYYGTGAYWRQIAVNNWHNNINNVQSRYPNPTDFVCKFFEVAIEKVERNTIPDGTYILTLIDA